MQLEATTSSQGGALRKALCVLMAIVLAVGLMPMPKQAWAAEYAPAGLTPMDTSTFSGGSGTEADPYLISSKTDFDILASSVKGGEPYAGKYFKLTADVEGVDTAIGYYFKGLNESYQSVTETHPFSGNFDGDRHSVTLSIEGTSDDARTAYKGLFAYVDGGTEANPQTFKNLIVKGSVKDVKSSYAAGVVAQGHGYINFTNVGNEANVEAASDSSNSTSCVGGILGSGGATAGASIKLDGCYNKGAIVGKGKYAGGLVGNSGEQNIEIFNSYNTGSVTATNHAAGLLGSMNKLDSYNSDSSTASIDKAYNAGAITLTSSSTSPVKANLIGRAYAADNVTLGSAIYYDSTVAGQDGTTAYYNYTGGSNNMGESVSMSAESAKTTAELKATGMAAALNSDAFEDRADSYPALKWEPKEAADTEYTITATATPAAGGTVRILDSATDSNAVTKVKQGDTISILIKKNTGYDLTSVEVNGNAAAKDAVFTSNANDDTDRYTYTFDTLSADATVTVTFTAKSYAVTATASPTEGGEVALYKSGGLEALGETAKYGDTVLIEVKKNANYKIAFVTATGGVEPEETTTSDPVGGYDAEYSFTMPNSAVTVTVTFESTSTPTPSDPVLTLGAQDSDKGTFKVMNGDTEVTSGTPVAKDTELKVVPTVVDDSYGIGGVSYTTNGTSTRVYYSWSTAGSAYKFSMPAEATEVNVEFGQARDIKTSVTPEEGLYSISYNVENASEKTKAATGANVCISPTPNDGYEVGTITVHDAEGETIITHRGNSAYGEDTFKQYFTMPSTAVTVTITLEAQGYGLEVDASDYEQYGGVEVSAPSKYQLGNDGFDVKVTTPGWKFDVSNVDNFFRDNTYAGYSGNLTATYPDEKTLHVVASEDLGELLSDSDVLTLTPTFVATDDYLQVYTKPAGSKALPVLKKSYKITDLYASDGDDPLVTTDDDGVAVLYSSKKVNKIGVTTKYVKAADLFADAGVTWGEGSLVTYGEDDKVSNLTYAEAEGGKFFPDYTAAGKETTNAESVPFVLALNECEAALDDGKASVAKEEALKGEAETTNAPRTYVGTSAADAQSASGKTFADERLCKNTHEITVTQSADIANASIAAIAAQTYTGKELKPAVKVTYNGLDLVENTDYTVKYTNNVNVGTAKVTITGVGDFYGTKEATFTIKAVPTKPTKPTAPTTPDTKKDATAQQPATTEKTVAAGVTVDTATGTATVTKSGKLTAKDVKAAAAAGATSFVLDTKVNKIAAKAFKGTKVTKVTIKSKKLKKKSIKNCFKGSKVKTVYVPAKMYKKYKKLFKKSVVGKKVTVKKLKA